MGFSKLTEEIHEPCWQDSIPPRMIPEPKPLQLKVPSNPQLRSRKFCVSPTAHHTHSADLSAGHDKVTNRLPISVLFLMKCLWRCCPLDSSDNSVIVALHFRHMGYCLDNCNWMQLEGLEILSALPQYSFPLLKLRG